MEKPQKGVDWIADITQSNLDLYLFKSKRNKFLNITIGNWKYSLVGKLEF